MASNSDAWAVAEVMPANDVRPYPHLVRLCDPTPYVGQKLIPESSIAALTAELTNIREELAHMRTSEAIQDRQAVLENVATLESRVSRRTDAEVAATNILTFLNTQKFHGLPIILEEFGCDAEGFRSTVKAIANLLQGDAAFSEPAVCEHGVRDGEWCEACNAAMKAAQIDPDNNE